MSLLYRRFATTILQYKKYSDSLRIKRKKKTNLVEKIGFTAEIFLEMSEVIRLEQGLAVTPQKVRM